MIQIISFILGLIIFFNILRNKANVKSLLWVIISLTLINAYIIISKFPVDLNITRWVLYSLLFSEFLFYNRFYQNWNTFPLKTITILLILGSIVVGMFDSRLPLFWKFYFSFKDIIETYFILFLGYFTIRQKEDCIHLVKPIIIISIIIGVYGLFNFITLTNPYYRFVIDNFFTGGDADLTSRLNILNTNRERFRATSTFNSPFNYGYISALLTLILLHWQREQRNKFLITALFCTIIGIFLSNSRTVLFAGTISIVIYIISTYKLSKKISLSIFIFLIAISSYTVIPVVKQNIDNTLDIFQTGGENTKGSSVEMRMLQLAGAYSYFSQNPLIGNGYNYIYKELGWGDRDNATLDSNMFGFESIIYSLLIEQGIIGLVTKLLFFISLITYFIKQKRLLINKDLSSLGISLTTLFLLFSIGTGALGAWPLTMISLGVIIKIIQLNKKT